MLQYTRPTPQPGGPPYAAFVTMPTAGLAPDVVLAPGQEMEGANTGAMGHPYDGPAVLLDDQALATVH